MNLILGLDLETNSVDALTCDVAEVGAVLWDTDTGTPIQLLSEIISGVNVPPEVAELTGITNDIINLVGQKGEYVWNSLWQMLSHTKVVVAHNGIRFDYPIMKRYLAKYYSVELLNDYVYVDTMIDVPYKNASSMRLNHLAADQGIMNPYAHRAVFDVLTMLELLSRHNIPDIITAANSPVVTVQAMVNYDNREKARSHGFRWDADNRMWIKVMRETQMAKEDTSEFSIRKVG